MPKSYIKSVWLVFTQKATLSNCGNPFLEYLTTTLIWKHVRGTRLIIVPNSNNVK